MAALNFPTSPSPNQVYIANGKSWIWDGIAWKSNNSYGIVGVGTQYQAAFYASDGQTISGTYNLRITGTGVSINYTTSSTSIDTGSFTVLGGVGIGKTLNLGGYFNIWNGSNYTGFKSSASANTTYTLPANSPQSALGTSVLASSVDGTMRWVALTSGGSATPVGNNTEIQFNDGGSFGGATGFTYEKTSYLISLSATSGATHPYLAGFRLFNNQLVNTQGGAIPNRRSSPGLEFVGIAATSIVTGGRFNRFGIYALGESQSYEANLRFLYSNDIGTAGFTTLFTINSFYGVGIGASDASAFNYFRTSKNQTSAKIYILPTDLPTSGATGTSVLSSDTSGNLNWVAMTAGSPGGSGTVNSGTAGSIAVYTDTTAVSAFNNLTIFAASGVSVNSTINVRAGNELRISASSNKYTALKANNSLGVDYTLTLPASAPSGIASSFLSSDTSGNLSFVRATPQRHRIQFAAALNPTTGADNAIFQIPYSYSDGTTSVTYLMRRVNMRCETGSSTGSSIRIEKYAYDNGAGIGTFVTSSNGSTNNIMTQPLTLIGSGIAETFWTSFAGSHITAVSGDKMRLFWISASTTQYNFSIDLIMEEQ